VAAENTIAFVAHSRAAGYDDVMIERWGTGRWVALDFAVSLLVNPLASMSILEQRRRIRHRFLRGDVEQ